QMIQVERGACLHVAAGHLQNGLRFLLSLTWGNTADQWRRRTGFIDGLDATSGIKAYLPGAGRPRVERPVRDDAVRGAESSGVFAAVEEARSPEAQPVVATRD